MPEYIPRQQPDGACASTAHALYAIAATTASPSQCGSDVARRRAKPKAARSASMTKQCVDDMQLLTGAARARLSRRSIAMRRCSRNPRITTARLHARVEGTRKKPAAYALNATAARRAATRNRTSRGDATRRGLQPARQRGGPGRAAVGAASKAAGRADPPAPLLAKEIFRLQRERAVLRRSIRCRARRARREPDARQGGARSFGRTGMVESIDTRWICRADAYIRRYGVLADAAGRRVMPRYYGIGRRIVPTAVVFQDL